MTENAERVVREEDLADDIIFEPSVKYSDRKVAIAVKDGLQVCWGCFTPISADDCHEALTGESLVRICRTDHECQKMIGNANRERAEKYDRGDIVMLADLTEPEREELVKTIKAQRKKLKIV